METKKEFNRRMAEQDALYDIFDELAANYEKIEQTPLPVDVEMLERERISDALARTQGNQTKAAKILGIGRTNLIAKMKKYGFESIAS